jgi:hypothetical protein
MTVGALVLAEGIVGMTEASAIRRPSTPRNAQLGVHHRFPARPRGAGTDGVEIARARPAKKRHGALPAQSPWRDDPALDQIAERRLRSDVEPQLDAGHQGVDVGLFRQEVGLDLQRAVGLRGLHPQMAPTPRPHEGGHDAEGVGGMAY